MRGIIPRRKNLQNAQAIFAVGNEGERAAGDHADFHVVDIVELAIRGKELIQFRSFRLFHVDQRQALFAGGNIGVGARDVNVSCILREARAAPAIGFGCARSVTSKTFMPSRSTTKA